MLGLTMTNLGRTTRQADREKVSTDITRGEPAHPALDEVDQADGELLGQLAHADRWYRRQVWDQDDGNFLPQNLTDVPRTRSVLGRVRLRARRPEESELLV